MVYENCASTPQPVKGGCKQSLGVSPSRKAWPKSAMKEPFHRRYATSPQSVCSTSPSDKDEPAKGHTIVAKQFYSRTQKMVSAATKKNNTTPNVGNGNARYHFLSRPSQSVDKFDALKNSVNVNAPYHKLVKLPANSSVTVTPIAQISRKTYSPYNSSSRKLFALKSEESTNSTDDVFVSTTSNNWKRTPLKPLADAKPKLHLLADITPVISEKSYGSNSSPSEKENVPFTPIEEKPVAPHLLGFPNLGNTCYLNAVMQSLVAVRVFRCDVSECVQRCSPATTTLLHALTQLLHARKTGIQHALTEPLRLLKENFEKLDSSFRGWKMQDANEFLTKVLDTVKDEVDKIYSEQATNKENDDCVDSKSNDFNLSSSASTSALNRTFCNGEFPLPSSSQHNSDDKISENSDANNVGKRKRLDSIGSEGSPEQSNKRRSGSKDTQPSKSSDTPPVTNYNNPISANFGFQLQEVYQCLGCRERVERNQDYYSLYVHLAASCDDEDPLALGPSSLRAAVADYMKEETRDLTCEKCGHTTAQATTRFTKLPRILIIQVKRYNFNTLEYSSRKVCSTIDVNKCLDLSPHCYENTQSFVPLSGDLSRSAPPTPCKATPSKCNVRFSKQVFPMTPITKEVCDSSTTPGSPTAESKLTEEEQFQEAVRRSLDDSHAASPETVTLSDEDDLQKAIRLSLQDAQQFDQQQQEEQDMQQSNSDADTVEEEDISGAGPHLYQLTSIVSHFGQNTTAGHYICDVQIEGREWRHYDDETVSEVSQNIVLGDSRKRNGYIFFYVHQDLSVPGV